MRDVEKRVLSPGKSLEQTEGEPLKVGSPVFSSPVMNAVIECPIMPEYYEAVFILKFFLEIVR